MELGLKFYELDRHFKLYKSYGADLSFKMKKLGK